MSRERGSASAELVLLAPVLVLFVTFVAAAGRISAARTLVRSASGAAAREASLVAGTRMDGVARGRVLAEIDAGRSWCRDPRVTVRREAGDGLSFVTVRAECTLERRGVLVLVPRAVRLAAESTEVIDVFTHRS